jgi:hypothetical protein
MVQNSPADGRGKALIPQSKISPGGARANKRKGNEYGESGDEVSTVIPFMIPPVFYKRDLCSF